MKKISGHHSIRPRSDIAIAMTKFLVALMIGLTLFVIFFYVAPVYSFGVWQPEQPLAYSHKLHAGELEINCQFCHTYARRSEMAGIPSMKKCMGCHENLEVESAQITLLKDHYENNKPIEWIKVYDLPDHVWFSHKRHIAKDIACKRCHGPTETLEVNARLVTHNMGFCLDCHQANNAPTDCWTCHI